MVLPPHCKAFPTCASLEVLRACLYAARSLVWLRTRSWTQQAQSILKFFGPTLQAAIGMGGLRQSQDRLEALNYIYIIDLQKCLIEGFHGNEGFFGLYQSWTDSTRFTGIAQLDRPSFPNQGGLSRRLFEHLFAPSRKMGKSYDADWLGEFILPHPSSLRALELFDIHAQCPRSNGVQKRQLVHTAEKKKLLRHRPPKDKRAKGKEMDACRSSAIIRKYESNFAAARAPKDSPGVLNVDLWAFKFRDAYTVVQQKVHVLTGNVGPLNILETSLRLLFMHGYAIYIAKGKASFSWKQAEKQDPDAVLRCSLLLKNWQTSHETGTARAILDLWFHIVL